MFVIELNRKAADSSLQHKQTNQKCKESWCNKFTFFQILKVYLVKMSVEPDSKRKKSISKKEALEILDNCENRFKDAANEMISNLCPFDITDEEETAIENRLERIEKVANSLKSKIFTLKQEVKKRKYKKKPEALEEDFVSCSQYSILQSQEEEEDLSQSFSQHSLEDEPIGRPSSYKKQPLNQPMNQRSRRRRVEEKRSVIQQWSEEECVSTNVLLGYLLYLENWNSDKKISSLGWKLFMEEQFVDKPSVSLEEAIWLIEKSGMSQAVYLEIRLRLKDRIYFPPVMCIREENISHRPPLQEYRNGVKAELSQCLSLSLSERLEQMPLPGDINLSDIKIRFKMNWGLDGSGEHSNYHQLSKVTISTKQIMSVCFTVREVIVYDNCNSEIASWISREHGANRPQNTRPLALFPSKECKELLEEFVPMVEKEVHGLLENGVNLKLGTVDLKAVCVSCNMSMVDGKMITSLLNCAGAYCTMCTKSQEVCHRSETILDGFMIERNVDNIRDLALSLTNSETGEISKHKGDYEERQGICGVPITESDLTKNIPVCHSKIRVFEWIIDLLTRYLSHKKWWTATNGVTYSKEEKELFKLKREQIKESIYTNLAINIGNPGDMVTGQAFQKFSSDTSRGFFTSLVDIEIRESFSQILLSLCTAVKVINSQSRKVNTDKLRDITQDAYLKIVSLFPWAVISPSVHRILAHSWEVVELNNCYGLGDMSEEGLEALNKQIRERRSHGARKDRTENNFRDTFNHLWDRSRPKIVEMERLMKKKKPKIVIST